MNINEVSKSMREVIANGGNIRTLALKLWPDSTPEQLEKRVRQISSLISQKRREVAEALQKQGKTEEEIPTLVDKVLPRFRPSCRSNNSILELLEEINGN